MQAGSSGGARMNAKPLSLNAVTFVGHALTRPECALAHSSGTLVVPDWTGAGGVSVLSPRGSARRLLARRTSFVLRPNGIALDPFGGIVMAHLGDETGGVFRLTPDGSVGPVLTQIGGYTLPPTNFVLLDDKGRLWITVSTCKVPRSLGYRPGEGDGFMVRLDGFIGGPSLRATVVADNLGYANECRLSEDGATMFVNETFARRITAFDVDANGNLSNRRTVAKFGAGTYPDGLTLDTEGGLWVTSIVSNRVIRVDREGFEEIIVEDCSPAHLEWAESAFLTGQMSRTHLETVGGQRLQNVSSLAFGGFDLRTAYLGSLQGDRVARFRADYTGVAPVHWDYDVTALLDAGELVPAPLGPATR